MLLGSVGEKAEVTDAHEAVRQDVKQEAADEFMGLKRDRLFFIPIFAISTFDTDYVLFKAARLEEAMAALAAAGHTVTSGSTPR